MFDKKTEFIKKYGRSALWVALLVDRDNAKTFARIMLAQAALETGWGYYVKGNNLFGIKDLPITSNSITFMTSEYIQNQKKNMYDVFEEFDDPTQSFLVYALLVSRLPRYSKAWENRKDPQKYFEYIKAGGWATDPNYAQSCFNVYKSIPENWLEIAGIKEVLL